jgi:hypothetical protein
MYTQRDNINITTRTNTVTPRVVVVFVHLSLIGHGVIGLSESELEFFVPLQIN